MKKVDQKTAPESDAGEFNPPPTTNESQKSITKQEVPQTVDSATIEHVAEPRIASEVMPQAAQKHSKQAEIASDGELKSAFDNFKSFDLAQRMARVLCASSLVPNKYQGEKGLPNAVIALEMAKRIGASPLAVMQNLYIVDGKPGWSAQFIIASLNSCGRYSPLRFVMARNAEGHSLGCTAQAIELMTGEVLEGPPVTINMAKMEGWFDKNGSKWKTMPEVMLRYRAASFFGKLYAPDILMGMKSAEELHDIGRTIDAVADDGAASVDDLNAAIGGQ